MEKKPDYNEVTKTLAQKEFDAGRAHDVAEQATGNYSIGRPQVQKVRYNHDAMIDLLIADPCITQGALANHFGMTQSWVCTVMASNAFQVRLASRRHELVDPVIAATIEEKYKAMATISVEKLIAHMTRPACEVDPEVLLKAAALGAKTMGLGNNIAVQVNVNPEERLKKLADKLTDLLAEKRGTVIDVESIEIKDGGQDA